MSLLTTQQYHDVNQKLEQAFTVSEINAVISDVLSTSLPSTIYVEGELSNFSLASSGHRYFSLIDDKAQISCALFKGAARFIEKDFLATLESGIKVTIKANLSVYQPRGSYQLIVQSVEPVGFGDAAKAFIALKNKLDKQGYTKEEYKKNIPRWPKGIAIVTSKVGAAIQDVIATLNRRAPFIPVFVFPTQVQGEEAPKLIAKAIQCACDCNEVEALLLVRGGGSTEDLNAFNAEEVAMAVVDAKLPIITGIGHETDLTIADFVSDYRCATPTAAAEKISPDKSQLKLILEEKFKKLSAYQNHQSRKYTEHLKYLMASLNRHHPQFKHAMHAQQLDQLTKQLAKKLWATNDNESKKMDYLSRRLLSLKPIHQLDNKRKHLNSLIKRLAATSPMHQILFYRENIHLLKRDLLNKVNQMSELNKQKLMSLKNQLQLVSPLAILDRGYTVLTGQNNEVVSRINQVKINQQITIKLLDGELQATVNIVNKTKI